MYSAPNNLERKVSQEMCSESHTDRKETGEQHNNETDSSKWLILLHH